MGEINAVRRIQEFSKHSGYWLLLRRYCTYAIAYIYDSARRLYIVLSIIISRRSNIDPGGEVDSGITRVFE